MTTQTDKHLIGADAAGCWIDEANWGRFGNVRLLVLAVSNGMALTDEDLVSLDRLLFESSWRGVPATDDDWSALIDQGGLADDAEAYLNEHVAPAGYVFGWSDGSFYLMPDHWWCDEYGMCDCTPEQIKAARDFL